MQAPGPTTVDPVGPSLLFLALLLALVLAVAGYVLYRRWLSRRALEQRLAELSQLADLGRAILNARLDSGRLAELVYHQAGQIVDTTFFQLGLFEGDLYRMLIWVMDGQPRTPLTVRLTPESPGIVGWLRDSRQPLRVRDFEAEMDQLPARPRYIADDPPRSAVFVPLLAGDRVLGAMAIQSRRPAAFTEQDLRVLAIIANNVAAAFETARLFEQTERRAAQLQLLAAIARRINVLQPLPAFYRQAVDLVGEQFGEYLVSLFILEGETLRLVATTRTDWKGQTLLVPLNAGLVGEAARTRRAVVQQNLPDEGSLPATDTTLSELAVPLQIEDRVLGVLSVQSQRAAVDEAMRSLFDSLAAQIAFATLEAQVYTAEQRRAEQLAAIARTSRSVVSTLELDDVLGDVLDLVEERFGYTRARIFLVSEGRLVFRAGSEAWEARWGHQPLSYDLNGPGLIAAVGRNQKAVLVPDVHAHSDYVPGPGLGDSRAEMAVPLVMAGHLLGVFDVQSEQVGAFSDEDVQTLQTLADTLAVAIRNARLFEAERRRRRLAETLREVSGALTSTLSLDGVLDLILSGLARVVSYDVASILLVNDVNELCLRAVRAPRDLPVDAQIGQPLDIPLFARGDPAPASVDFQHLDRQGVYHGLFQLPDPHACLAASLVVQDEHLGYLVVDRVGAEHFPAEEAELITAFASQASVAIENARLYTAQREQAWVSTALLQVAEAMAEAPGLEEALATVVRVTPMLVGVDWCAVLLADESRFAWRAHHHAGDQPAPALPDGLTAADWPKLGEMVLTEEPVVVEPDDAAPDALHDLLQGVAILLPLWVRGQVQGALVVGQAPGETPFTTHRIRLIGGIANQASLALESALLDEAQQEEAWVNAALLQVAESVAGQPTLSEALEMVVRLMPMLVGVEHAGIFAWDHTAGYFTLRHSVGLAANGAALTAAASDLEIDPFTAASSATLARLPDGLAAVFDGELAMIWPLWARQDLRGALVVGHVPGLGRRLNLLNGIAHQLAMAMESAALAAEVALQQRLEQEMALGRDIQASFLPEACPQVPGWELAAFYRSARLVGGDFYDFIRLRSPDDVERWGIAIADVSDKGVPAALFMALSRTLLRSAAMSRTSPAATLTRVNELILADARSQQFVTVFYAVWEPATGRFTFANAGHNPPVMVCAEGEPFTLPARGAALGVFAEYLYAEHELYIAPGDAVLLYTDGLTDAIDSDRQEFGLGRVKEIMDQTRHQPAQIIMSVTEAAVQAHVGAGEAFDDMTMVALKRVAEA